MSSEADISALRERFDLGPIDQISFAVADVEARIPFYQALFGGEFTTRRSSLPAETTIAFGEPTALSLVLGFGKSGDLEVELVQVVSGNGPTARFLESHGEGLHHVRFPVADHSVVHPKLEAAGYTTQLIGTTSFGTQFSYMAAPADYSGHLVVELIEFAPDDERHVPAR